jgi:DNA-binding NarL/FixJ family response regulator
MSQSDERPAAARAVAVRAEGEVTERRIRAVLRREGLEPLDDWPADGASLAVLQFRRFDADALRAIGEAGAGGALVIVVLPRGPRANVRKAVEAGAAGVVWEDDVDRALHATTSAALSGQVAVPRDAGTATERPNLSAREKQILGMVVMGFTNGEIAARLHVAESTVKSHLSSSFNKLGVTSRSEATELILDPHRGLGAGILTISGD